MKDKIHATLNALGWEQAQISDVSFDKGTATLCLEVNPELGMQIEDKRIEAEKALMTIEGVKSARVIMTAERNMPPQAPAAPTRKPPVKENLKPKQIKHIIAVASGKGGVGKSTVAVNLAVALSKQGLKVGIMDADIYGPSIPKMLKLEGQKAKLNQNKKLDVLNAYGISVMSIGFLVDAGQPMIWRGPMVQSAIRQFLVDVDWPELDVLVVDMPPGTGDAQLTFAQKVPLSGAVIVSTPQDIAFIDAAKGIEMFRQTNVPILGVVENMSSFCCPNCGVETDIFGSGLMDKIKDSELLGRIPLELRIREGADSGKPIAQETDIYDDISKAVQQKLFKN